MSVEYVRDCADMKQFLKAKGTRATKQC